MTSVQSPPKLSLTEFLELPETKPASEYINGQIYQKPMPKGKHSRLQIRLATQINHVGEPDRIASAFTELRCTFGGRSIVPDIAVFSWQRIPVDADGEIENNFEIYPDWTIEILSPNQSPIRVIDNILFCLDRGTELGWLIDPQERMIMVLKPEKQPEIKRGEETLPVLNLLKDWQISVQDVFSWLSLN
ncbi:Uma2 family endonuclease [Microcoleus sp. LEGE 07076]|uniref:Uma2 family endonuclease n=1 Tax=Microcoleus sp. LEGE 07076 TaxID=915322 RepID=UPI0018815FED|nr:Uma2 family endonuclease [Microcoleus sp. LEGE 07076]MBE9187281.1 Uma2 family endonuclease [Microcoleus sp. LEGE 07076]